MLLVFIFEHIPILKQLPHFSSCRVFRTYPDFETKQDSLIMGQVLVLELVSPGNGRQKRKMSNIGKIDYCIKNMYQLLVA